MFAVLAVLCAGVLFLGLLFFGSQILNRPNPAVSNLRATQSAQVSVTARGSGTPPASGTPSTAAPATATEANQGTAGTPTPSDPGASPPLASPTAVTASTPGAGGGGNTPGPASPTRPGATVAPAASGTATSPAAPGTTVPTQTQTQSPSQGGIIPDTPQDFVLTKSDLPAGYVVTYGFLTSNEDTAKRYADSRATLDQFNQWGRIRGYAAGFQLPGAVGTVSTSIEDAAVTFKTSEGAHAYFGTQPEKPFRREGLVLNLLQMATVGEESKAYQVQGVGASGLSGTGSITNFLVFRKRNAIGAVEITAKTGSNLTDDLVKYARLIEGKMK